MKNLKKDISRVKWFLIDVTAKVVILFCKIANIQYGIFLTWFEFFYKFIAVVVHWWYFIKKNSWNCSRWKKVTQLLMIFFLINIFSVWRKYKFKKKNRDFGVFAFCASVSQNFFFFFFFFCFLSSSGYILINLWIVVDWNEIEGKYCTTPQCYNTFFIFFRLDRRENKV